MEKEIVHKTEDITRQPEDISQKMSKVRTQPEIKAADGSQKKVEMASTKGMLGCLLGYLTKLFRYCTNS